MTPLFADPNAKHVFGEPMGVDFSTALVCGLRTRLKDHPPEALARVTLLVNTRRMARRLEEVFQETGHGFVPRLALVSDPAALIPTAPLPPAASPLRIQLELAQLVGRLLEAAPDLAPRSAAFDLAGTLRDVLAEMQEEVVPVSKLETIETGTLSAHWERSLQFLRIVSEFLALEDASPTLLSTEARQALALEALKARWDLSPPQDPIIVAGSTGSRGPTLRLMQAVLALPQGAVILPGFDTDMPASVWQTFGSNDAQDHPQFRYHVLSQVTGVPLASIESWSDTAPVTPPRNRLVSLALRPAPVTNQWRTEGPELADTLAEATHGLTLLEAKSPRDEAAAIALRLREAAQTNTRVALISPDRVLTRQVTAALRRWGIEPDDSAGSPLGLSAPGRLLRLIAGARGRAITPETLLTLLKHPLTHSGREDRGAHLLRTRDMELELLRPGCPFPDRAALMGWLGKSARPEKPVSQARQVWVAWLCDILDTLMAPVAPQDLSTHLDAHITLTERLCAGPNADGAGALWLEAPGREALKTIENLRSDAHAGGVMLATEYATILSSILQAGEVRDPNRPHPNIMIWGAMEARVQGADLVILAGLNDGIWPDLPAPDPWMNRAMRATCGLRLPDRRIGLAAHDFQQAIAGAEVWLTRSLRDSEAETVPSRWLNRLTNLMSGLGQPGEAALQYMRSRAAPWITQAALLDRPDQTVPPEPRPAPAPPVAVRPRKLSVTRIQTLIRDPYAIYAAHVLKLRALDPLRQSPDAPLKGTIIHDVMEAFTTATKAGLPDNPLSLFDQILTETLQASAPWPAARRLWRAKLLKVAPWFLEGEAARRLNGIPVLTEERGGLFMPEANFTLSAEADRIDEHPDGRVTIFDYKTGALPKAEVQKHFDRQMPLEALIVEGGGFTSLGPRDVAAMIYIGLGSTPAESIVADDDGTLLAQTRAGLARLIQSYDSASQGYASNRAMEKMTYAGDYDHLARKGEWDGTTLAKTIKVGQ